MLQFIRKMLDGVEVKALCGPLSFFHTTNNYKLFGPGFMDPPLCSINEPSVCGTGMFSVPGWSDRNSDAKWLL